jgi:hypothetical protein
MTELKLTVRITKSAVALLPSALAVTVTVPVASVRIVAAWGSAARQLSIEHPADARRASPWPALISKFTRWRGSR